MESFNEEFCEKLNSYLMEAIRRYNHPLAAACWMNGVLLPSIQQHLSKKHVNDTRKIETQAWALTNRGDVKFNLAIYFGKYALRRYAKGSALEDCLPSSDDTEALKINFEEKRIELQLV